MAVSQPASFKRIQIIFTGLFAGQFMMALALYYVMQQGNAQEREVLPPFNYLIPGVVVVGFAIAYYVGLWRNKNLPVKATTQEKLEHFQTTSMLKYAFAEGGNLISLVLTFLQGNTNYLMFFGLGLAAFVFLKPDRNVFISQYDIGVGEEFD